MRWLLLLLLLVGCRGPLRSDTVPAWVPSGPSEPPSAMRLYVLRDQPVIDAPMAQVVEGAPWSPLRLPTLAFLVVHPKGNVLIDAGYGSQFPSISAQFPARLFYSLLKVDSAQPRVVDHLRLMGMADSVRRIIITHWHTDHLGGVVDFPNAKVLLGERNCRQIDGVPFFPSVIRRSLDGRLRPVDFEGRPAYETFAHGYDLYGDGSIVLVDSPGHTDGHLCVFVNLPSGKRFLLAGDVAWIKENYLKPARKGWPMRMLVENAQNEEALHRLHRLHKIAPEISIVPSHDPEADASLLAPPGYYR